MSSDEGESNAPVLPKDSDPGSSVSSGLQNEYEELLRYAVVTPKFAADALRQSLRASQLSADGRTSALMDDVPPQRSAVPASEHKDRRSFNVELTSATHVTPPKAGPAGPARGSEAEQPDLESEQAQTPLERSNPSSSDPMVTVVTEMFITEENISKMEDLLDTWSSELKVSVVTELRKWKLAVIEQHRAALKRERQKHAAHLARLSTEMDGLKELLHVYDTSNQRKDEVISNLTQALERQKERLELMRTFCHWRMHHNEAREESRRTRVAEQHYQLQLKRKVWTAWQSLMHSQWKRRVERVCQGRAEEVCSQLSTGYESKMAEYAVALERAQAEIQRLQHEREHYEESMKKAFMRGVCALNMEAMSIFHPEGRLDPNAPPSQDEPGSSASVHFQVQPTSPIRLGPSRTESASLPSPTRSDPEQMLIFQFGPGSAEALPSRTVISGVAPPGGTASTHRPPSARLVTFGQQRAPKIAAPRAAGQLSKRAKKSLVSDNLQVMGVTPPMSTVVVERHHPVTQLTVSQATAAKYPRSSQNGLGSSSAKKSAHQSPTPHSSCFVQSIKVVQ
ncbi:centrosomal protein POC5-like [Megalops cyprinoides]|uniref:centrosomal protein POC5-like n=1 Tax=Megalops cyprinoides TaxID=118141 RepID=UPI001863C39E|nr:centrosomal protein POC5-like [Megalops cyprinoides]